MKLPAALSAAVESHPYPLLFASVSGAHLYGFPSPDSDFDLRGVHILPLHAVLGLDETDDTVESARIEQDIELDLVTHDIKKFFRLMLQNNGYVLEQLYSPIIVHALPEHEELREIGKSCVTRYHVRHYLGFANKQWKLFEEKEPRRVKPLLYVYRVLLTGIHLMNAHYVEANLVTLNETYKLPYIADLIDRKLNAAEKQTIEDADIEFHRAEYERLCEVMKKASESSTLPDEPTAKAALNDLLQRVRLQEKTTA